MAHVFQVMAGTSRLCGLALRAPISIDLLKFVDDVERDETLFGDPELQVWDRPISSARVCPICRDESVMSLTEVSLTMEVGSFDWEDLKKVRIGATGIVLPSQTQMRHWFKAPIEPSSIKSKRHRDAAQDGKHHAAFTFFASLSFVTVFFSPNLITLLPAAIAALASGYRSWLLGHKLALEEDKAIAVEHAVRRQAFAARSKAWDNLTYCSGCGMVHDRKGKRSVPWYSMLHLVAYPEPETRPLDDRFRVPEVAEGVFREDRAA